MSVDREALASALLSVYDVTARTTEAVTPALDAHGLTFNTAFVLWCLDPAEQPPSMRVLAERTRCTPPNLTFLCDQLEARALILRTASTSDRRQRIVQLTDAGRAARDAVIESVLASSPLSALSSQQLTELHRILQATPEPRTMTRGTVNADPQLRTTSATDEARLGAER